MEMWLTDGRADDTEDDSDEREAERTWDDAERVSVTVGLMDEG